MEDILNRHHYFLHIDDVYDIIDKVCDNFGELKIYISVDKGDPFLCVSSSKDVKLRSRLSEVIRIKDLYFDEVGCIILREGE